MLIRQMLNVAKWHCGKGTNRILGAVTCKSRIVLLKWLKNRFAMRKCIGFDFNRFLHATGLDIWNRAKDVVPLQSIWQKAGGGHPM